MKEKFTINFKKICIISVAVLLEFFTILVVVLLNHNVIMTLPLAIKAVLTIAVQWLFLIVPIAFMKKNKEKLSDFGFSRNKIGAQILMGIIVGLALSLVFTLMPILAGLKDMVGSTSYTEPWQFFYQFVYMIFGVALAEEFFYRGFLFKRLSDVNHSKWFAIIVSSVIFGISHVFGGNIIQIITTTILGIIFCICRDKFRNCTTLSLIIAHGMHNALITLFVAIL